MIYGEHLSAEEVAVPCSCGCGMAATVEIRDKLGQTCGWFTRGCAPKKRAELRRYEKLAKAILRKVR